MLEHVADQVQVGNPEAMRWIEDIPCWATKAKRRGNSAKKLFMHLFKSNTGFGKKTPAKESDT